MSKLVKRLVCPVCFNAYCPAGERHCGDCAATRNRAQTVEQAVGIVTSADNAQRALSDRTAARSRSRSSAQALTFTKPGDASAQSGENTPPSTRTHTNAENRREDGCSAGRAHSVPTLNIDSLPTPSDEQIAAYLGQTVQP